MKKVKVTQKQLLDTFRALLPEKDRPTAEFRPQQAEVIRHILSGRDMLAIIPTGGGKSACYQVPAMYLPGITLVVSPLKALMEDQVAKLNHAGFPAACLSSDVIINKDDLYRSRDDDGKAILQKRGRLYADIYRDRETGYQNYKLLYVTPERLLDKRFLRFARRVEISMIAVDEAHCVSQWGYGFRPSYLEIFQLMERIGYHPIIAAFTATATPVVQEDIAYLLNMRKYQGSYLVVGEPVAREKLRFSVRQFSSDREKLAALLAALRQRPVQCGYVFCARTKDVNKVYQYLRKKHINATRYFADLDQEPELEPGESKAANFQSFLDSRTPVMVCTNALGMGIDKADVRFAFHYNMPPCLENYYQEAGRAGRDGKGADCVLFYTPSDEHVCQKLTRPVEKLSPDEFERYWGLAEDRLREMVRYAERGSGKTSQALQEEILSYLRRDASETVAQAKQLREQTRKRLTEEGDVLYVNCTRAAHALREGEMEKVLKGDEGEEVSYQITEEKPDYFDLMIADAVYTLMVHRVTPIRAKGVMALLSGDRGLLLRPERREEVDARIRKMMRARIKVHWTHAYDVVYDPPHNERSGAFLPLWEEKDGFGYDPRALPPLYELAEVLGGQFFSLPLRQLHIAAPSAGGEADKGVLKYLAASRPNLSMTHYLLLHVNKTRAPKYVHDRETGYKRKVDWDKLLRVLDLRSDHRHARRDGQRLREAAHAILGHLKAENVIRDFEVPAQGPILYTPQ